MKNSSSLSLAGLLCVLWMCAGCSDSATSEVTTEVSSELPTTASDSTSVNSESTTATEARSATAAATSEPSEPADDEDEFAPLSLGSSASLTAGSAAASGKENSEQQINDVIAALKPLQVMLGKWSGKTRLDYDGFKAVDEHEWIWDLQSNPVQPALKINSNASPYLKEARLTWDVQRKLFRLTATDKEGITRDFEGTYTDPVHEIVGPDDKLHRVFRLELTQTEDSQNKIGGAHYQLAFAQQENNRYLLEVDRRRGKAAFRRYDTVSTQREGTSFAISDTDYGDKTCIISQGLGTMAVSYKGKSYWVCCSGCKAAFDADPETWIARAAKRNEAM